ncbi:MAG: glucosyl transferase, partial [Ignavibacteriaceae bacterium]|nr:glucosyl transferase [Ignavibacteriaceae bacterium]
MKRVIVGFLVIIISLLIKSCDTADPPDNKSLTLKLEDVSCTEAWIELTSTNLQLPTTVTIKQNSQTQLTINLVKSDTLLYIDSLLPNVTYNYQASGIGNQVSSNVLNVTTLNTTSHDFTWQTWTFGEHSHSRLNDVTIINENNIWAVGEIYMN